jgi:arylsulfatase A
VIRAAAVLAVLVLAPARPADRPNVILILADDFGFECVGANGGTSYRTPNLDRLAAGGARFTRAHVQPLCTPTRVELMTGRSNVRNYVDFGNFPASETTFAQLFKKAGYATGVFGKWQLGREVDLPKRLGFDTACLWQHTRRPPRYANPGLEIDGVEKDFKNGEYGPDVVNAHALDFIAKHRDAPFFLYYPMMLTHDPFQPTPDSPDWDPALQGEQKKRNGKHFGEMVAHLDKLVGTVLSKLDELKLRENTLIVFLGDNGTLGSVTSRLGDGEVRGGKGKTTARGMHVPLIASWPAALRAPRVVDDLVGAVDVLPTLCEAAGVPVPGNLDGRSFLPQAKGDVGAPREWLYSWYSPRQNADVTVKECAFDRDWKLYRDGRFFDLKADVDEVKPLALEGLTGDAAAAAAKLRSALDRFKDARPAALDRR